MLVRSSVNNALNKHCVSTLEMESEAPTTPAVSSWPGTGAEGPRKGLLSDKALLLLRLGLPASRRREERLCTAARTSVPRSRVAASVHRRVTQSSSHRCFSDAYHSVASHRSGTRPPGWATQIPSTCVPFHKEPRSLGHQGQSFSSGPGSLLRITAGLGLVAGPAGLA